MKKLAQIIALALVLNAATVPQALVLAQKPKASNPASRVPREFADAIKQFEEFAQKHMALDKTVGLTIGFVKDNFEWVKAYGYADLENKVPAKPESAYRLA